MKSGDPKDGLYLEDKDYVKDISAAARYGAPPLLHLFLWESYSSPQHVLCTYQDDKHHLTLDHWYTRESLSLTH